ncbi:hypothetical protein UFOVP223_2 [uncultured Caudovirales phage]|uniref:Uncharacterized protein n=1 Tax=uncultured Caudovirales phage TaxID=2100421 RepID=A0A6J5L431_9CAUD|nr:hypothetical protein UFOVP110_28 [uncultured Caudovirales phage]CAB5218855.1 hypothetical protein UFOVP223_2 [uncultured Caudovirales phage]
MTEVKVHHTPEWLEARSRVVAKLVEEGILDTKNGQAGFYRGDEWVSIYELLEGDMA